MGDTFTLSWQGENGAVSLAEKGLAPFVTGLPSSGSQVLTSGAKGYPMATGAAVYEAAIGDAAKRLETTVTVNPRPTPSVSLSGEDSCHPRPSQPCEVALTAIATSYTSLSWTGCCAGSSGTDGRCKVRNLSTYTCTVTAIGDGGTASASRNVTGVNAAPVLVGDCSPPYSYLPYDCSVTISCDVSDEDVASLDCTHFPVGSQYCGVAHGGSYCVSETSTSGKRYFVLSTGTKEHDCNVTEIQVTDEWGATASTSFAMGIANVACPPFRDTDR
jgi:hypothetical protein